MPDVRENPMLARAKWLIEQRGFSVIPLDHPDAPMAIENDDIGKLPVVKWKAFQTACATGDNLHVWFNGKPRNLGIVTGAVSKLVAVDGDSEEGVRWMREHLPETQMRTKTAKGEHWFYRHPGGEIRNAARINTGDPAVKVDIRADGGYVVAPYSKHISGVEYQKLGEWPPVEQLPVFDPKWLAPVGQVIHRNDQVGTSPHVPASERSDREHLIHRARRYLDKYEPAIEGQGGDQRTYAAACLLVNDFALDDVDALMLLEEWNTRCIPPWTSRELEAKIQHVRKYGRGPTGSKADTTFVRPSAGISRSTAEPTTRTFPHTDLGNAEYFTDRHGADLRFDHRRQRWLAWDGVRWNLQNGARDGVKRALSLSQKRKLRGEHAKLLHRPHIPMLKERNVRKGFFEREQFETVRLHLPQALRPVVTFAYITGWRVPSEVLTLQWHQVDLKAGVVRLEPGDTKNEDARQFYFGELLELKNVLDGQKTARDAHAKASGKIVPWVFHRNGKPIKDFRDAWENACKAAGCPGKIPHDFRRTAVRNLVRAGVIERVAMQMTGHKTRSVFERYNIVSETDLRDAARRLSRTTGL